MHYPDETRPPYHGGPSAATLVRRTHVNAVSPLALTARPVSRATVSRAAAARTAAAEAGFRPAAPSWAPAGPVTVAVLAQDALTAEGTIAYLRSRSGVVPLNGTGASQAEVVLVLAGADPEQALSWMKSAADQVPDRELRFVVVADGVREPQLLRAVPLGIVSVLPRAETSYERIVDAVLAVREDPVELPAAALDWLAGQLRSVHRNVPEPTGLTPTGLEAREVDVLRLLADGLDTAEIADRLNYSQRTVKNIIHGLLSRLKLRNRQHAVAYALRHGLL
jgi:DNA-binding NarL/FixJ family response regulator